ncbi:hypothetical protein C8R47DRAFT_1224716 [Mycena vitilis]|nr:hypothetical protein C8R47DRAFT_1224716 [Mycena vitilis]
MSVRPPCHEQLYDIGLVLETEHLAFLTRAELLRGGAAHREQYEKDRCTECHHLVTLWGWGEYSAMDGELARSFQICKGCFKHHGFNWGSAVGSAPPCTCPADAIAGENTDSGCALHVVPAMRCVPRGVPRVIVATGGGLRWRGSGYDALDTAVKSWQACFSTRECPIPALRPPPSRSLSLVRREAPYAISLEGRRQAREAKKAAEKLAESAAAEAEFMAYA